MRVALILVLVLALLRPAVAADPVPGAADQRAIRQVIERQIDAFRRDDGAGAFAFASPAIQAQFGSADVFMAMVRTGYAAVYRPRDVRFLELGTVEGRLVQRVGVVGPDGRPAVAHYVMQRQPDGSWRIDGCVLTRTDDRVT